MTPSDKRDPWWDFRRRRRLYFGLLFGGVIAVPLLSIPFEGFFADPETPYYLGLAIWSVVDFGCGHLAYVCEVSALRAFVLSHPLVSAHPFV